MTRGQFELLGRVEEREREGVESMRERERWFQGERQKLERELGEKEEEIRRLREGKERKGEEEEREGLLGSYQEVV